ncbi:MAG: HNH endonuclease [Gemmatimonadota bacterium]
MPDLAFDQELRLALFDHVRRLRDQHAGVIPSSVLSAGMTFRGGRVPIWNQQKGIFKPAILGRQGAALTVQTSADGPYDDGTTGDDGPLIYKYRGTDPDHPDNVALRRAGELQRPLLYLIGVRPGLYEAVFPVYVTEDRPDALEVTLLASAYEGRAVLTSPEQAESLELRRYATRTVKQRLHQRRFRYLVLDAYREQCAMCRLRPEPLLDAAHILPARHERGRPEIPNGLALCKIHHSAYDVGILGVDPDYRIHLREDVLAEHDGPMLRHGLQEMHNQLIQVPRRPEQRPNREFLAERFERFRAA